MGCSSSIHIRPHVGGLQVCSDADEPCAVTPPVVLERDIDIELDNMARSRGAGLEASLQRGDVDPAFGPEHEFPVEDELDIEFLEGGDDLREYPVSWRCWRDCSATRCSPRLAMQRLVD